VGFRRNYLQELPADRFEPLHVHEQTDVGPVVAVCEAFWLHELLFEILDIALCAVLLVYTTSATRTRSGSSSGTAGSAGPDLRRQGAASGRCASS